MDSFHFIEKLLLETFVLLISPYFYFSSVSVPPPLTILFSHFFPPSSLFILGFYIERMILTIDLNGCICLYPI
jgi:hypothetical protein